MSITLKIFVCPSILIIVKRVITRERLDAIYDIHAIYDTTIIYYMTLQGLLVLGIIIYIVVLKNLYIYSIYLIFK